MDSNKLKTETKSEKNAIYLCVCVRCCNKCAQTEPETET